MSQWPRINPGELRKRIEIQQQPNAVDGLGQPVLIWPSVYACYAAIDDATQESPAVGREMYDEGLVSSRVTHIVTMRWTNKVQIVPGMRVFFADQAYSPPAIHYYAIEFIENAEQRNVILRLGCWEINAPG